MKPALQATDIEAVLAPAAANDLCLFSQRWVDDNANTQPKGQNIILIQAASTASWRSGMFNPPWRALSYRRTADEQFLPADTRSTGRHSTFDSS